MLAIADEAGMDPRHLAGGMDAADGPPCDGCVLFEGSPAGNLVASLAIDREDRIVVAEHGFTTAMMRLADLTEAAYKAVRERLRNACRGLRDRSPPVPTGSDEPDLRMDAGCPAR
jgi:hypothetical protein